FRLAGLFGDDNLIRHRGLVWWTGFESAAIRTYSELAAHRKSPSGRFALGRQNRGETPPSGAAQGAVDEAACSIKANHPCSVQRFYRVSEARLAPDRDQLWFPGLKNAIER